MLFTSMEDSEIQFWMWGSFLFFLFSLVSFGFITVDCCPQWIYPSVPCISIFYRGPFLFYALFCQLPGFIQLFFSCPSRYRFLPLHFPPSPPLLPSLGCCLFYGFGSLLSLPFFCSGPILPLSLK